MSGEFDMINPDTKAILKSELAKGEELLWTGQAERHPNFNVALRHLVYSLIVLAIVLVLALRVTGLIYINQIVGEYMPLGVKVITTLVTLLVIGLLIFLVYYMIRIIRHMRNPVRYAYMITNQRALIINPNNGQQLKVISHPSVAEVQKTDQTYSLRFVETGVKSEQNIQFYLKRIWRQTPAVFFHLSDGLEVKDLIQTQFPVQGHSA